MGLRYAMAYCARCKANRPHTKRGGCCHCRRQRTLSVRRLKRAQRGALVRFADVLSVAWDLWSVWIRALHETCEACGGSFHPSGLQGAHGISRERKHIRFHLLNVFALCAACHVRYTHNNTAWHDWMAQRLGAQDYELLLNLDRMGGKFRQSDALLVIIDAKQRIAALASGPRKEWALSRQEQIERRMVKLGVRAA